MKKTLLACVALVCASFVFNTCVNRASDLEALRIQAEFLKELKGLKNPTDQKFNL